MLVQCGDPHLDDPLPGPRARQPRFEHLAFDPQFVARPHRLQPAQLAAAADDVVALKSAVLIVSIRGGEPAVTPEGIGPVKEMSMDATALLLSRIQFAFTVSFHIIFPAFTIGLAAWLTVLEALHLATGRPTYRVVFEFWLKIFGVAFGLGVALLIGIRLGWRLVSALLFSSRGCSSAAVRLDSSPSHGSLANRRAESGR